MNVTGDEAHAAICSALSSGDDVLVHASLGRIGQFEAGVEAIIDSLRHAVGRTGTVVMMADTRSFARTRRFSMEQPSETGLLTEVFRLTPGTVRSCVPMVSFCALGARQDEYTQSYHSHLDPAASITRLLENDGKIMLLGIGYEKCTLYHLAEERHEVPYNFYKSFEGMLVEGGKEIRPISQRYFVRSDMQVKKDPSIAGRMLESRGQANVVPLGLDAIRTFRARDFDQCCMDALDADPNAFLAQPDAQSREAAPATFDQRR